MSHLQPIKQIIFDSMKKLLPLLLLITGIVCNAQNLFNGMLINRADNKPVPYAVVKLSATGHTEITDSIGHFSFSLPSVSDTVVLEIAALGFHSTIKHINTYSVLEKVYINKPVLSIKEVTIKGLSAKKVVEKALAEIPNLYANTAYACNSFYRQIHKENGRFVRLIELQSSTMFKIAAEKRRLTCTEAMATIAMRRSYDYEKNRLEHLDHYFDLLAENPILHPIGTVLNPAGIDAFIFRFDTVNTTKDWYVIIYESQEFGKESISSGKLTINKNTFAICKLERFDRKNKRGDFRMVLSTDYISDFISGSFTAEYEEIDGKWYLKRLLREYTNQIYQRITGTKSSYITETFEWYAGIPTNKIAASLIDSYYNTSKLYKGKYTYDKTMWATDLYPYIYFNKDEVYKGLSHTIPIEEQFEKAGE